MQHKTKPEFTPVSPYYAIRAYVRHTGPANGVDIKTVSGMLGHHSAGFTLDTYTHVTTSAKKEAANTMGSILSGALQ